MTHKRSNLNVTIRILLKVLILLSMPVAFIVSQWGTIDLSSYFFYASYLFQIGSSVDGVMPTPIPGFQFVWSPPLDILSVLLVALPAILFNLYLLKASKPKYLGRGTALVIFVTISNDLARNMLFPGTYIPEAYSFAVTAYFPWILTILVFFPLLFRQTSIFTFKRKHSGALQHPYTRLPPREWYLALILGIAAVLAPPFLYTAYFGGSMFVMLSAVGRMSFTSSSYGDYSMVDFVFRAYFTQDLFLSPFIIFLMLIPGCVFIYQILRYCGGNARRTSTILIGILSWIIPYIIAAIFLVGAGVSEQLVYPFPILLMIGGLVLLLKKPIDTGKLEEMEKELLEPSLDERAPEVRVPLIYLVWSKLKTSRLNPLRD